MNLETYLKRSYVPYSGEPNLCFVEGTSGKLYPGVRIENISYPLTISAHQSAIFSCLSEKDIPVKIFHSNHSEDDLKRWVEEYGLESHPVEKIHDAVLSNPLIKLESSVLNKLKELAKQAVIPNSDFPVAVLIETDDGFISGVNVESREWHLGLCAERVVIAKAVAAGYTKFNKLHIYAPKGEFVSPCGACRQVINEWMNKVPVELYHGDGTKSRHFATDFLPWAFTSESLKKPN